VETEIAQDIGARIIQVHVPVAPWACTTRETFVFWSCALLSVFLGAVLAEHLTQKLEVPLLCLASACPQIALVAMAKRASIPVVFWRLPEMLVMCMIVISIAALGFPAALCVIRTLHAATSFIDVANIVLPMVALKELLVQLKLVIFFWNAMFGGNLEKMDEVVFFNLKHQLIDLGILVDDGGSKLPDPSDWELYPDLHALHETMLDAEPHMRPWLWYAYKGWKFGVEHRVNLDKHDKYDEGVLRGFRHLMVAFMACIQSRRGPWLEVAHTQSKLTANIFVCCALRLLDANHVVSVAFYQADEMQFPRTDLG